jgi:hypothetical protein
MADAVADTNCTTIHVLPGTHATNVTINHDLTILGSGADQTFLDGGNAGRTIYINAQTVTISGVTIQNGFLTGTEWGAGIQNYQGQLALMDSRVINNRAEYGGGLFNNGGGVATAVITNVEFSGNEATATTSSAISNQRTQLEMINVTISGNHAVQYGAFINGGFDGWAKITNSSIISNTSNSGGSSTGINNSSTITFTNTMVAFNGNSELSNCGGNGTEVSLGYNVENMESCGFDQPSDLPNTDPKVSDLADNGGPSLTHALLPGSPAIDSGTNSTCPATDQRGAPRPINSTCDRGAYEYDGVVPNPTPTATATAGPSPTPTLTPTAGPSPTPEPTSTPMPNTWYVDAANGDDGNSCMSETAACQHINAAINKAGHNHTVLIAAGLYVENVVVDKALTIQGAGADATILDGNQTDRTLYVDWTANATVSGVTIQNGRPPQNRGIDGGGGIVNIGSLSLSHSRVINNEAPNGGGILNTANLHLSHVEISSNTATGGDGGGGIRANSTGNVTLVNVTVSGNSAPSSGSGIGNWGEMSVVNSTIADNMGTAGVFNFNGGDLTIKNSILAHDTVDNCTVPNLTSEGHNLETADTCNLTHTGDQTMADPRLEPLSLAGALQIHALPAGSPAIDAGTNDGCPATDQSGEERPLDGDGDGTAVCEIGAYEAEPPTIYLPFISR